MPYEIWNRRYTGSKFKLSTWICELITEKCKVNSFCDLFAGTAIISKQMVDKVNTIHINDFLYSNEIIYKAFFEQSPFDSKKIQKFGTIFANLRACNLPPNYVSEKFGNKFFSINDALTIGHIRELINEASDLNDKEANILLASLLYSADKAANTVGHYDAYIKGKVIKDAFVFDTIIPYEYPDKHITISREDANVLAKEVVADIVYIDPPYNSRQYSRFYHVLENIATWKKPELFGEACKPEPENMSDYCKSSATKAFEELICSLQCNYIAVSYNNTYNSKSSSSKNKIALENIKSILGSKGSVEVHEKPYHYFNAGKTNFDDHKELVFIARVGE